MNYFGPLGMCRAFAPILAKSRPSAIANVLSAGGPRRGADHGRLQPFQVRGACDVDLPARGARGAGARRSRRCSSGSVDTRMASHVKGAKEKPETIAAAGLAAIRRGAEEVDTDTMAIEVRAQTIREPEALARRFAKQLGATEINTGR